MKHNYYNCHNLTCRNRCKKDGYGQALADIFLLIREEKKELGSLLENEDFMNGYNYLETRLNQLKAEQYITDTYITALSISERMKIGAYVSDDDKKWFEEHKKILKEN